ncbi:putative allantoate permease [Polychaeton citri CBS 116435]|uniref:Allantoate permease n=1 Tax=Polychaeton citri CBS 116435 TaxID=1314669 RepID=A0A9P4Q187_9PEZI|nr:putative allantoate permease [Polychaeton citri CBS 116435]
MSQEGFKGNINAQATAVASDVDARSPLTSLNAEPLPVSKPARRDEISRTLRSIQRYVWDDPDKSSKEKWFLFKLDAFLLTIACLGYFSKNLDQANINNAYVSGMKEALHMEGNQLTYAGNVFTAGYVIGQLPAVMLVSHLRPSILIPTAEVLWSLLTFCNSAVKTPSQLYAVRFLIAVCEGIYFPVLVYIIGSWYTKHERGKRMTIFFATGSVAGMFSGYLQAAAYKGLGGKHGLEGWQWLYITCGIISLPIALLGFFIYPDFPETTRAIYLTKEEVQWARERILADGMKPLGASSWNWKKIFHIMSQWQFWVLPVGYFLVQGSFVIYQPIFALWLKSTHHTVYEVNVWPTGQFAISVVTQILAGMLSDSPLLHSRRWQAIVALQTPAIFGCIVLAVWHVPIRLKYAAYYLSFTCGGVPGIYYACFINSIWWTLTVWRTALAPRFDGWPYVPTSHFTQNAICFIVSLTSPPALHLSMP